MAHWIITDMRMYECSTCEGVFDNYYCRVSDKKECPCCGEPIIEAENEHRWREREDKHP